MTGDSAMACQPWSSIVGYGPSLRRPVQLALDPECAGQKSVGRQNVADGGMRAATREVNICANGTEVAGRIGRSTLQCTMTIGFRFVTRLNTVCKLRVAQLASTWHPTREDPAAFRPGVRFCDTGWERRAGV